MGLLWSLSCKHQLGVVHETVTEDQQKLKITLISTGDVALVLVHDVLCLLKPTTNLSSYTIMGDFSADDYSRHWWQQVMC